MKDKKKPAPPKPTAVQVEKAKPNERGKHSKKGTEAKDSPPTDHVKAAPPPKPENDAALSFLERWGPPWALSAIHPTRKVKRKDGSESKLIQGKLFQQADFSEMAEWIAERNGKFNMYFSVNPVMRQFERKAGRENIKAMAWLHVDIDARAIDPNEGPEAVAAHLKAESDRIQALLTTKLPPNIPPPSVVTFSGGGYQAFWKLAVPVLIDGDVAKYEDAKLYNVQLETLFDGDNCHNVDRIMRLPGTVNVPDALKQKKGRKPELARVIKFADDVVYPLEQFTKAVSVRPSKQRAVDSETATVVIGSNIERLADVNLLDRWQVSARVKVIIVQGHHPEETKADNSRSSWLFDAICNLYRKNVPDDVIYSVITDKEFGISASVLDKGSNIEKYALRQMERAKAEIANEAADFRRDKNELIVASSQHNIRVALRKLGALVRHDEFQDRLIVTGVDDLGPLLDERAMLRLWLLVDAKFGFRPAKDFFWDVVSDAARCNGFHPVRDYLDFRSHGMARLALTDWLATYGGAAATDYTRAVGALMLVAAVHRVRQPGCKLDEMLVLESEQGTNKSSALKVLAVEDSWFTDDMPLNADGKGVIERLTGRWIVSECAELRGMRRGDIEHVKAFLSRQTDRARLSYDRLNTEVPRQSVFFGTTNSSKYLRDTTGARRFWPVRVTVFDLKALKRDRDQLWAEAAHREAAGESIRLDPALYGTAAVMQGERSVEDPFFEQLADMLGGMTGKLLNADAWEIIGVPMGQRTQEHNARLGEAMRELGWQRVKARVGNKVPHVYVRGDSKQREKRIFVTRDANNRVSVSGGGSVDTPPEQPNLGEDASPPVNDEDKPPF